MIALKEYIGIAKVVAGVVLVLGVGGFAWLKYDDWRDEIFEEGRRSGQAQAYTACRAQVRESRRAPFEHPPEHPPTEEKPYAQDDCFFAARWLGLCADKRTP